MVDRAKSHIAILALQQFSILILTVAIAISYFLYTFDIIIDKTAFDIALVNCIVMFFMYVLTLALFRDDMSIFSMATICSFISSSYFLMLRTSSTPIQDLSPLRSALYTWVPLLQLLFVIIFMLVMMTEWSKKWLFKQSAGAFNGENLEVKDRNLTVLLWIDTRPARIEYLRAIIPIIAFSIIPSVWYVYAIKHGIDSFGAAFLGGIFWIIIIAPIYMAFLFPLFSRPAHIQFKIDGIWNVSGPAYLLQERISWSDVEKMRFSSVVGINIAIVRETGERWIRCLSPNTLLLIEKIVQNGLHKNIDRNIEQIIVISKELGMKSFKPEDQSDYFMVSNTWTKGYGTNMGGMLAGLTLMLLFMSVMMIVVNIASWMVAMGVLLLILTLIMPFGFYYDTLNKQQLQLRPGKDVFNEAKEAIAKALDEVGQKYETFDMGNVAKQYRLKMGKGMFGNGLVAIQNWGDESKIVINRGAKENADIIQKIRTVLDRMLDEKGLKKPAIIVLK